jgi:phage replication-related protein YjqB (UPF0714/DUF867 family)
MATPDAYSSFDALAQIELEGVDFQIRLTCRPSPVVVIAPHGGAIEPGTSEIAVSIAADSFSVYCFEGLKPGRPHQDLHITSTRFDEPNGLGLVEARDVVLAVHGRKDDDDEPSVWLGGRDETLRDAIGLALEQANFLARTRDHRLPGREPANICNRGRRKAGVQLEIPRTLRSKLVADDLLLQSFTSTIRYAIEPSVAG